LYFRAYVHTGHTHRLGKSGGSMLYIHLWLIKVWFSASTFVVKIGNFAKPKNMCGNPKKYAQNDKPN